MESMSATASSGHSNCWHSFFDFLQHFRLEVRGCRLIVRPQSGRYYSRQRYDAQFDSRRRCSTGGHRLSIALNCRLFSTIPTGVQP